MSNLALRDLIPLKEIDKRRALYVPKFLSRETADRLIRKGYAQWRQIEHLKRGKPRGFVELTAAGKRVIQ